MVATLERPPTEIIEDVQLDQELDTSPRAEELETTEYIELPGLIDVHVHLRQPGATHKETFETGTKAALAGGIVAVFDMPNNPSDDPENPFKNRTTTHNNMVMKRALAEGNAYCDIGFWGEYNAEQDNMGQLKYLLPMAAGTKFYVEPTTGNDKEYTPKDFREATAVLHELDPKKIIAAHVEDRSVEDMIGMVARDMSHPLHIPHTNNRFVLEQAIKAKQEGLLVTVGVCPHHLFLTEDDVATLGWYGRMKPALASQEDQDFLWANLDAIDVFETDHAPHTKAEKDKANQENPEGLADVGKVKSYGVPGLDTLLPLLLNAVHERRLTMEQLLDRTVKNPAKLMGYKVDPRTKITVAMQSYEISQSDIHSKVGWSPFIGKTALGRVVRVDLHGRKAYENGEFMTDSLYQGSKTASTEIGLGQVIVPRKRIEHA